MATAIAVLFPWNDTYSVKIAIIDIQHKKLIDIINELHQAMATGKGRDQLGTILSGLVSYTQSHFKSEEGILLSHQYPDFANHKPEHERFVQTLLDFQRKFENKELGVTIEVMGFLKDWLAKHIMGVDQKYAPYLHSKGVR